MNPPRNITPDVPQLDPMRVQLRKHALLNDIGTKPSRRWWWVAAPATALAVAAVVVGVTLWVPGNQPRDVQPGGTTAPAEADPAVQECRTPTRRVVTITTPHDWTRPAPSSEVVFVDQTDEEVLVLFVDGDRTTVCVSRPEQTMLMALDPRSADQWFALLPRMNPNAAYTGRFVLGKVRQNVRRVEIELDGGQRVPATAHDGWVAAWWATQPIAKSVTTYGENGEVLGTQPVP